MPDHENKNDDALEKAERHQKRMQKKKQRMDAAIANADKKQGLFIVITGPGKGKSTSAFGMIARALGHNMKVSVGQFVKSRSDTGESAFFKQQEQVDWHTLGDGFTWETQNLQQDIETAQKGWAIVKEMLNDSSIDLVVIDELTYALNYKWLDTDDIINDIQNRPPMQHVVVTGRGAPKSLIEVADTVSEIKNVKHAYNDGIQAQNGIDL